MQRKLVFIAISSLAILITACASVTGTRSSQETAATPTSLLADGEGSREAHEALGQGFVTSGLAVLRYAGEWADIDFGTCELTRFHVSRGHEE